MHESMVRERVEHHKFHSGYYVGSGSKLENNDNLENSSAREFTLEKKGVFSGAPGSLVSFFINNPSYGVHCIFYTNALNYSKSESRITEEQFGMRKNSLEESSAIFGGSETRYSGRLSR